MKIILPDDVKYIINKLTEHGYEAYAVGGCVRDSILCRVPGDWDITTSARPDEVKALFRRTIDTGIVHGTVTVMLGNNGYEVTTYRLDGAYEDGRHPVSVEFTASLIEDLKRRDFTINAMAYNDEMQIVDAFSGMEDLDNKIIRCVGSPKERFTEDALRMLRAVRFSAQLGFTIDGATEDAIKDLAPTIKKVSMERIHVELDKTLLSDHPDYIEKACELGITKEVLALYDEIKDKASVLSLLKNAPKDVGIRYACIFCEFNEKDVHTLLKNLKFDNNTLKDVCMLVKNHGMGFCNTQTDVRKRVNAFGPDDYKRLLEFEHGFYVNAGADEKVKACDTEKELLEEILGRGDCCSIKDLAVNGSDLISLGIKPGREMGFILNECLMKVIENPECNTREILTDYIRQR